MPHTPGPWINQDGLVTGQESRARFAPGTSVDLFDASEYPAELRDEMMANAALIAAAPDLLLAVKCLCEEMADYMALNKLGDPTTKHNYRLGMAAIAKAESDEHPLDKHLREAAVGKTGLFRDHACWKCRDGAEPCVRGEPNRCEYPYARND